MRRQRADARRNRDRIVEVAIETFREQGIDASVAEIARRADVGSGTLFRHFPSKAELIDTIVAVHKDRWIESVSAAIDADDHLAAFDALFLDATRFNYVDRGMLEVALIDELNSCGEAGCDSEMVQLVERLLDQARAAGALRDGITAGDVHALAAGVAETARIAVQENDEDPELALVRFSEILLRGLRP